MEPLASTPCYLLGDHIQNHGLLSQTTPAKSLFWGILKHTD